MISIRIAEQADKPKWDEYVTSKPDAWPYHLFAWKNAVEHSYGHKSYYLIAENQQSIVGVLPSVYLHFPYFTNELTALPYCDVGSVLCDNEIVFKKLLASLIQIGKKYKVRKINIRGQLPETDSDQNLLVADKTNKVRMLLNLPISSKVLMAGFKSKLRSQIRKAEKNGLVFRWGNTEVLDKFYSVLSVNMRDLGSPVHSKRWYQAVLVNYEENAKIGLVEMDDKVVGSCMVLMIGDKVSIPWASTLREYNRLAPNMLLYWNVLKYSCDQGYKLFDFGRSSENEGTYKFKAQWGAMPEPLEWYSIYTTDRHFKKLNSSTHREQFEKLWQRLPVNVANQLGPIIRKYISL